MGKTRKSTIGTKALDSASTPLTAVLGTRPSAVGAPAARPTLSGTPAQTSHIEPKTKSARRVAARKERGTTLTVETTVERTVYTREEAAKYLGTSPATLWRVAQEGQERAKTGQPVLGYSLIGKRIRFLREDLDRYARGEAPRPSALVGWAKNEERAERMRQTWAARKAQG